MSVTSVKTAAARTSRLTKSFPRGIAYAAFDAAATSELLGLLRRGADRLGSSVIMATHDPEVAAAADRVIFLESGRVAADLYEPTTRDVLLMQAGLRRRREGHLY